MSRETRRTAGRPTPALCTNTEAQHTAQGGQSDKGAVSATRTDGADSNGGGFVRRRKSDFGCREEHCQDGQQTEFDEAPANQMERLIGSPIVIMSDERQLIEQMGA